jgi:2-oxoisovalerate dehydrogenase E1 component beta subunit
MGTINKAMLMLAEQPNAVFIGQGVRYGGVATYRDLEGVPDKQRIEFPVAEELQLGCCIGLSLQGYLPICIFPRMDFMLRAADQLVNHLDKLAAMSCGQFVPKVIIRTRVGSKTPLDAGPQHTNDHTDAFRRMLTGTPVIKITSAEQVLSVYREAIDRPTSSLIVEALGA